MYTVFKDICMEVDIYDLMSMCKIDLIHNTNFTS